MRLAFLLVLATGCMHSSFRAGATPATVGAPHRGMLLRPVRLAPRGLGYEVFRTPEQGGEAWGTDRLVGAIRSVAAQVHARAPGATLRVGDLSAEHGGEIERHRSHRSGRDGDLLYFALDAQGRSVLAPGFVRYDRDGNSVDTTLGLRFDTRRNWLVVETLARDEAHGVARVFCADWIRALLVAYARSSGRDTDLIARVEQLLRQPGDSAPHDDHFHVRVACTSEERAVGCIDGAPLPWWLEARWDKPDRTATVDDTALLYSVLPDGAVSRP